MLGFSTLDLLEVKGLTCSRRMLVECVRRVHGRKYELVWCVEKDDLLCFRVYTLMC